MDNGPPPLSHELAPAVEKSEEDLASHAAAGLTAAAEADGSRALPPHAVRGGGGTAATAGVSATNVELAIMEIREDRSDSFDGMRMAGTAGSDATATGDDSNMPDNDKNRDGSNPSSPPSLSSSIQRRRCRGCRKWWRSSAGGKSGVVSVVLAVIILLYAGFIVASPFVIRALLNAAEGNNEEVNVVNADTYLQLTTSVNVVVGSICVLLVLFTVRTIHRITCARKRTLVDIAKTSEARRDSKWYAIRMFERVREKKEPNSPYVSCMSQR